LATALIKTETRIEKAKKEKSDNSKRLKAIIKEQEECMGLMQLKMTKLENKNIKLLKKEEKTNLNI
jgi:hypothetical protein